MPYCPECGYEYREGITSCPDCGQALTDIPPEDARNRKSRASPETTIIIYEAPDASLSNAVKKMLEDAGIPVMEDVYHHPFTTGGLDISVGGNYSRLLTTELRAKEAQEIVSQFLAAYQRDDLALTSEEMNQAAPEVPVAPHRGLTVLVLGILGLALWSIGIGVIPAVIAWAMGNKDLRDMKRGDMDFAGKDMTEAGRLCAIIAAILAGCLIALWAAVVLLSLNDNPSIILLP
jgi:uncharacterized Zn finger protein (UPF0148 family)